MRSNNRSGWTPGWQEAFFADTAGDWPYRRRGKDARGVLESGAQGRRSAEMVRTGRGSISTGWHASPDGPSFSRGTKRSFSSTLLRLWPGSGCLRCLLLVMCTYPFAKKALTLHLARGEGRERYFGCNLMQRKVLASSHQHLIAEAPVRLPLSTFMVVRRSTGVQPTH